MICTFCIHGDIQMSKTLNSPICPTTSTTCPVPKSFVFIHVKYVKFVHMSLELAVIPRVTVSVVGETGVDILSRFSVELCI